MRLRWPLSFLIGIAVASAVGVVLWAVYFRPGLGLPKPLPVPDNDREIAWINNTSAGETWSMFVIGVKRIEMPVNGTPSGLTVDDSNAFPEQSTTVPELVIARAGVAGKLRIRWYKATTEAPIEGWVKVLAARDPAPLAVVGGWSSDWAHKLALALEEQSTWRGDRPLLFITTATVDNVLGVPDDAGFARVSDQKNLIDVYSGRSFRFCFSNAQMVSAVSHYVLHDPTLRPGAVNWPGLRALASAAAGPFNLLPSLAGLAHRPTVFPLEWQDDPYSGDLYNQFREHLYDSLAEGGGPGAGPRIVRDPAFSIPFSIGGFSRVNAGEAAAVRAVLTQMPPVGERTLLVIPTGSSAPARRVLLALSDRLPAAGRRVVAVTGDGFSVNTFYRDAEWAWPARSIPIPVVLFAHDNPFGWDTPGDTRPPPGYRLEPKTTTEEVLLDYKLGRMVCEAVFADGAGDRRIAARADEVAERLRTRPDKFFDDHGNRRGLSGEHVAVVRPTVRYGDAAPGTPRPESVIEVYRREENGRTWVKVGAVQVQPRMERPDPGA